MIAVSGRAFPDTPAALTGPPRLAAVRSPAWGNAEDGQRRAFAQAIEALRRAGASVEEAELPDSFGEAIDAHRSIMAYEGAISMGQIQRQHCERLSARLNALLDEGAATPRTRYEGALETRAHLREAYGRFLHPFGALITPPAPGEAPATLSETGNPVFCTLWTLLGVPAITIPVALGPRSMPLGLQLVGASDRDAELLSVAAWCEKAFPALRLPE